MYFHKYNTAFYQKMAYVENIFLKVLGLSPWTTNISPRNHRKNRNITNDVYELSCLGSFYNILLITSGMSILVHYLVNHIFKEKVSDLLISDELLSGLLYLAFFESIFLLIIYTICQKKMIVILNRLKNVDERLEKCAIFKIDNTNTIHVIFIANFVTTCGLIITSGIYFKAYELPIRCFEFFVKIYLINQYSMLLDTINKHFKSINSTLIKLGNIKNYQDSTHELFMTKTSLLRGSFIYDVINLKVAYIRLCEISQQVSDFFGLPILRIITFSGALTTISAYFIISTYLKTQIIGPVAVMNIISILWINIAIVILTNYATETIKESNETPIIVNALMDQYSIDERIEKELDHFLHELSFRKVAFTAWGVIPLERSLLATVAGTCVTYLVILIQFRSTTP